MHALNRGFGVQNKRTSVRLQSVLVRIPNASLHLQICDLHGRNISTSSETGSEYAICARKRTNVRCCLDVVCKYRFDT